MKIVLLHYAAAPIIGGVESVIRNHSVLMAANGHEVRIIAGRGQQVDQRVPFLSVPLVDSRNPEVLAAKAELDHGRVPHEFDRLRERIGEQLVPHLAGVDWLICHNVCSLNKNLALTAALHRLSEASGLPRLILWHHDLAWTTPRYASELHDGYPWNLLRQDWPQALQVAVSAQRQTELAELIGVDKGRVRVIPNGIDAEQFIGLGATTRSLFRDSDLSKAAPLALLPVRITPRKNIELALHIVAALRHRYPDVRLLVTGPMGPHNPANAEYLDRLLRLRRDLGLEAIAVFAAENSGALLPDEAIAELYRAADLMLLTSREEGFGLPILEAGLAGVPVFCADIPSLRELGGQEVTYLAPQANAATLAATVISTLEASPRYRLRRRILDNYTWDAIYASHLEPLLGGVGS